MAVGMICPIYWVLWGCGVSIGTGVCVSGESDNRFARVQERFIDNMTVACPRELGAALAVYVDGRLVVDLWGGYADQQRTRRWQRNTPVCVFSCTKGVVSILAMRLVQAGLLDYDALVADYWPEYARHGKEETRISHLLGHQAGLPVLEAELEPGDVWCWPSVCTALSNSSPKWRPGSRHGYHALTWGYLVGSVLERAGAAPLETLLQREVCEPFEAEFSLGLAQEARDKAANLVGASSVLPVVPLHQMTRLDEASLLTPAAANSPSWRGAIIPGANGHCSAGHLAKIYQGLLDSDRALVAGEIIERATTVQTLGQDAVLGMESAYGMGFQLATKALTPGCAESGPCWGHKGIYGATGFIDPDYNLAVAYVMNYCGDSHSDERSGALLSSIYECL